MKRFNLRPVTAVILGIMAAGQLAEAQQAESRSATPRYSLFRPVPHDSLRALGTDRPGNGENPFTLDPGHFQVELGAVGFTHVGNQDPGAAGFYAGASKLRIGVVRGFEVQGTFDGYSWRKSGGSDWSGATGGYGARAKINLWGDYSGSTAVGLIPSIYFAPDGNGGHTANAGLVATFAGHLPAGWGLAVTFAGSEAPRADGTTGIAGSGVLGFAHPLHGPLTLAFELTGTRADLKQTATEGRFGSALLIGVSSSFQADAGVDLGFTHGADAVRAYFGLVRRF